MLYENLWGPGQKGIPFNALIMIAPHGKRQIKWEGLVPDCRGLTRNSDGPGKGSMNLLKKEQTEQKEVNSKWAEVVQEPETKYKVCTR